MVGIVKAITVAIPPTTNIATLITHMISRSLALINIFLYSNVWFEEKRSIRTINGKLNLLVMASDEV